MIQAEGPTRFAADGIAANADPVIGITTVLFRYKNGTIRPEPTWDDVNPDPELDSAENEVEITFKNMDAATSFNELLLAAKQAGTTRAYFAAARRDAAVSGTNKLFSASMLLTGVDVGGKAGQENTQRQVFPCGAISAVSVDPIA
jgi:hypothetical protein